MPLRITTWNVNGIRNPFGYQPWREKRTFQAMFDILEADVVVMQETKIQRKDLKDDMVLVPGWDVFFSLPRHKKGYSGVAIYTRTSVCCPMRAEEGITGILCPPNSSTRYRDLPTSQQIGGYPKPGQLSSDLDETVLDSEGRCVILEFPGFVLIGTYSPANRDSSRDDFRLGYLRALEVRVRNLVAAGKQVILTGDLNVSRSELDTSNLAEALRKESMTMDDWMDTPSRRLFNHLLFEGHVVGERDDERKEPVLWDLCRCFYPDRQGMFTCWDTKRNTRPANNGSRIDYVLCSSGIKEWFVDSNIQEGLMGSDHCPVYATLKDVVQHDGQEVPILDLMNSEGMTRDGNRTREWTSKDILPLSAKLIPEFDRRRNIRDMFSRKPSIPKSAEALDTLHDATSTVPYEQSTYIHPVPEYPATSVSKADSPPGPRVAFEAKCSDTNVIKPITAPKRTAENLTSPKQNSKRTKANDNQSTLKTSGSSLAQSSLMGFLKPKPTPASSAPIQKELPVSPRNALGSFPVTTTPTSLNSDASQPHVSHGQSVLSDKSKSSSSTPLSSSAIEHAEKVFDPIQVKETWSKFQLGKRVAPKCEHGEPCISFQTKKPGVNCGRSFYICPRPLGPSGEKERGTQWRCATFIWSSDWKKEQS